MHEELPLVSVVIPAYNEEKRLEKCLASIDRQEYPAERIEIILVDDDSNDRTVEIALSYGAVVQRNGEHNIESGKSIGAGAAKGDFILLLDADNSLPQADWLSTAVRNLLSNQEAAGAQSAWFEYRRDDPAANRYCALFGINDPFAYYLEKRDKLTWFESSWVISGEVLLSGDEYFLVRFTPSNLPTVGSQGYLISRDLLLSTNWSPYLFHMEMNQELVRGGHDIFVMLKNTITHDHCTTVTVLLKKLRRNFTLFLEQRHMRTYRWETTTGRKALALIKMITIVVPTIDSIKGYRAVRDPAWFIHPLLCLLVPVMYSFLLARWLAVEVLPKACRVRRRPTGGSSTD